MAAKQRKIAVVTGTRAEYGLLYWIIKGIQEDPDIELQLIVTGMHLSPEFGLTVKDIEKDGFVIADKIEILLSSDTETATALSMGIAVMGFAKAYERLNPDILLVLGDRFEILAAVAAAVPFRIPVAHIHGGESTEGSMDELFRHAITKMSHIHFPVTQQYADRIVQMGENPENVFCYGAPGLENIYRLNLLNRDELFKSLQITTEKRTGIVTYHPATLEDNTGAYDISQIIEALKDLDDMYWVFTYPNADMGGRVIAREIQSFVSENPEKGKVFSSLGQLRYLSLMKHAALMVGNSSSGIIEAPSFRLPVVNIGDRQRGRIRTANIIDVPVCEKKYISKAILTATSQAFIETIKDLKNPYGGENTSIMITKKLKEASVSESSTKKRFYVRE